MTQEELDDAKLGTHSVDTSPVEPLNDEGEFDARFQIETEAVFKRLARDIYESDSAGIREPLTNAITAILRAVEHNQISADEGVVEIKVQDKGDGIQLTMRDNGVGMTMDRIREIVAVIGASEARDIGEMAGQFGMGFLAVFRLVGIDGGFEMYTNPRYSDEGPISGIWKSGGFTRDTEGLMAEEFDEDEYGTKFNFIVKNEISRRDIRSWVSEYAEWARVPVVYEEIVDGRTDFEENYGGFDKTITSPYDDDTPYVEYEDEYVQAASSPDSESRTILLDVPCERNRGDISTILGNVDIRLKNENGVVVEGPHEGLMVVSEGEFQGMDEERREKYVSEKNLTESDVVLPQPTGTRRVLNQNNKFWSWIQDKLQNKVQNRIDDIMSSVSDFDDLMSLDKTDFKIICLAAMENVSRRYSTGFEPQKDGRSVRKWFNRNSSVNNLDKQLSKQIAALVYPIQHAESGCRNVSKKHNLKRRKPALAVYDSYNNGGRVFMGCRLSQDKSEIIWEDSEHNYVFRVESTDHYDHYEDLLGWEQMKEIKENSIDEFDISESTKADFLEVDEDEIGKNKKSTYKIKLHFGGSSQYTKDITTSDLCDLIDDSDGSIEFGRRTIDHIILFPSHMDRKISDNYWASDKRVPMARCRKKDWQELKEYDMVSTLDQKIENSRQIKFDTSEGEMTIAEFEDNNDSEDSQIMFHLLEEPYRSRMASEEFAKRAEEFVNKEYSNGNIEYTYAAISKEVYRQLKPSVINHGVLRGDYGRGVSLLSKRTRETNKNRSFSVRNDTRIYAWVRLYKWNDTEEFNTLYSDMTRTHLNKGGYALVETLRKGFEAGSYSESLTSVTDQIED